MPHYTCDEFLELIKKRPQVLPDILASIGVHVPKADRYEVWAPGPTVGELLGLSPMPSPTTVVEIAPEQSANDAELERWRAAVAVVLMVRRVPFPVAAVARIAGCTDLTELESWLRLSVSVSSTDELFG